MLVILIKRSKDPRGFVIKISHVEPRRAQNCGLREFDDSRLVCSSGWKWAGLEAVLVYCLTTRCLAVCDG